MHCPSIAGRPWTRPWISYSHGGITMSVIERTPVLLCYSLGKAQRMMAEIQRRSDRSVKVHGAVATLNRVYEQQGIDLCPVGACKRDQSKASQAISSSPPPQVAGSSFLKRFQPTELAMASGWMQVRGVQAARINPSRVRGERSCRLEWPHPDSSGEPSHPGVRHTWRNSSVNTVSQRAPRHCSRPFRNRVRN